MNTIWKYKLEPKVTLEMPSGSKVLSVAVQERERNICLWALVDPKAPKAKRSFRVYGTGHSVPEKPGNFIGTVLMSGGALVFHVFEEV